MTKSAPATDAVRLVTMPDAMTPEMEQVWRSAFISHGHLRRNGAGKIKHPESCERAAYRALRKFLSKAAAPAPATARGGDALDEPHGGIVPDGMTVHHRCGVTWCVNPAHLFAAVPQPKRTIRQRIDDMTETDPNTGCQLWTGSTCSGGKYGKMKLGRKEVQAHRLSLLDSLGLEDSPLNALHKCDTSFCVNPNHLYLGSLEDNARDLKERGPAHNRRVLGGLKIEVGHDR